MTAKRYETLDGLRGVAAIGVMVFHFSILGVTDLLPRAFLAVQFFFVLSGFALSCAYEERASTLSIAQFAKKRLIRILPLSVLGLTIGTIYFFARTWMQPKSFYSVTDISLSYLLNLFLLPKPWVTAAPTDTVFPSNTPLWSLSLEMMVNMVWAACLIHLSTKKLWIITVTAGLLLSAAIFSWGTADLGADWITYAGGVLRASFGFCVGILIWRHCPKTSSSKTALPLTMVLLLTMFSYSGGGIAFDLFSIIIIVPALLYVTIRSDCGKHRPICRYLGQLSYPLYTIHVPLLMITVGAFKMVHIEKPSFSIVLACAIVFLMAAFLVNRYYDVPLRRFLNTRLESKILQR